MSGDHGAVDPAMPPGWLPAEATAWPHPTKDWTVRLDRRWARCLPEIGQITPVGHDPRLPGLDAAVTAGEELMSWRIGRRAVLRRTDGSWRKVTRPHKLDSIAASWAMASRARVPTPAMLDADNDSITIAHRPGASLHDESPARLPLLLASLAQAIRDWHASPHRGAPRWQADPPERWVATTRRASEPFANLLLDAMNRLPPLPESNGPTGLIHGDLHDKNIVIDDTAGADAIGFIDVDDVRFGPIEVDTANLAAHFTLRALQRGEPLDAALPWSLNLIEHVAADAEVDRELTDALLRHTWFRLAALYFFRPAGHTVVPQLLRAATSAS